MHGALQHVGASAREGEHADNDSQGKHYAFHVIEAEDHIAAV